MKTIVTTNYNNATPLPDLETTIKHINSIINEIENYVKSRP